jgi:hypothetical protein
MGLDMFAYSVAKGTDLESEDIDKSELAYWRKFNALHGWMEELYRSRGGSETFNCVPVQLTYADLDLLEHDIAVRALTPVEGFFFGEQTIYPEDIEATKRFIADAREQLDDGRDVYYDSWW